MGVVKKRVPCDCSRSRAGSRRDTCYEEGNHEECPKNPATWTDRATRAERLEVAALMACDCVCHLYDARRQLLDLRSRVGE